MIHQTISGIYERLKHVKYVFLDEVSMLDCSNMYTISSQMSMACVLKIRHLVGKHDLCGDFAQLPPPAEPITSTVKLWRQFCTRHIVTKTKKWSIGKSLWHQVTVVVILSKHEAEIQTPEDAKFRTALENMHYKSCTDEDIALLRSRISGTSESKPKLSVHSSDMSASSQHWMHIGTRSMNLDPRSCLRHGHSTHQLLLKGQVAFRWWFLEMHLAIKIKGNIDGSPQINDNIAMGLQESFGSLLIVQQTPSRKVDTLPWNASYDQAQWGNRMLCHKWCRGNGGRLEGTLPHCWKAHSGYLVCETHKSTKHCAIGWLAENVVPSLKANHLNQMWHAKWWCHVCSKEQVPVLLTLQWQTLHPREEHVLNNCRSHQSM